MPESISTLQDYLDQLRRELASSDPALIQDALYDAEEHLRQELAARDGLGEAESLREIVEKYGTPSEVAEAYRNTETQVAAALAPPTPKRTSEGDLGDRLFGIFLDPRTYGSLFYMFLALATGILYFTWVAIGLSLSLGLSILIFGIPVFLLFMATVRAISLIEGRIVETLLGERMPRRPLFDTREGTWLERVKHWLSDGRTWSTMLYMVFQLPFGILYFTLFTFLTVFSGGLFAAPFAQLFFDFPIVSIMGEKYHLPLWSFLPVWATSFTLLFLTLHLARLVGRMHGGLAKAMLVRE